MNRSAGRGAAGLCLLFALLAACAPIVEPDHLRLCRDLLPALHAEGTTIRETRNGPVTGARNAVKIDYLAREPGRPQLAHYALCRFGGGGTEAGRFDLAALETERGEVSEIRLFILRRWWLGDGRVLAEASARREAAVDRPDVPFALAYLLQQTANGLVPASLYGLLAVAYALIYGLVGRINLAFGDIAVAGAYAALGVIAAVAAAYGVMPALLVGVLAGGTVAAATNLAIGRAVVAPIVGQRESGQSVLIATVGAAVALSEGLRLIHGSSARWAPPLASTPVPLVRSGEFIATVTLNQLCVVATALTAAGLLLALMHRSRFGRAWRAFADDPGMAALFGVDPQRMVTVTFALAGALAGLAGVAHAVHFGSAHFAMGTAFGLKALVAAILGGIGSIPGAFLGGLALGLAETLWSGYLPIAWRDIAIFSALVALIIIRPAGLAGTVWRRV
jgi:branched-chain amino acid transport system permease protein